MANALYPEFKEHLLNGDVDFGADTVNAYLVDLADYTYAATHDLIADLPAGARVASVALGSVTVANENVDAADAVFASVTGDPCEAVVITVDTGAAEYLCAYYDTSVTGLPVTPNGADINLAINASGLFDL